MHYSESKELLLVNDPAPLELVITEVGDHFIMRLSRRINGISIVLEKSLKYFNGTPVSTFYVLPSAVVFPVVLILSTWALFILLIHSVTGAKLLSIYVSL